MLNTCYAIMNTGCQAACEHGGNMKKSRVISLCVVLLVTVQFLAAADPALPPGKNFNLGAFKLQALTDDNKFIEIFPEQLAEGYSSQYFYTDANDGSIVMRVPSNGATTSGKTGYSRSELRQIGSNSDWLLSDPNAHEMTATISVDEVAEPKPQIIIGQIHGSEKDSEMLKLRWTGFAPGKCYVEAKFQKNDASKAEYGEMLAEGLSLGDKITYTIIMREGMISVTIKDKTVSQQYSQDFYGSSDHYYFKAGNYFQYKGTSPLLWGTTRLYNVKVVR